jgi:hypothetical protein
MVKVNSETGKFSSRAWDLAKLNSTQLNRKIRILHL